MTTPRSSCPGGECSPLQGAANLRRNQYSNSKAFYSAAVCFVAPLSKLGDTVSFRVARYDPEGQGSDARDRCAGI
jgi:hypothetical protein